MVIGGTEEFKKEDLTLGEMLKAQVKPSPARLESPSAKIARHRKRSRPAKVLLIQSCWSDSEDDKEEICLMAHEIRAFCDANGITHNFSAPRSPQSNGVVEHKNRTLQEMARTMLNEQSIPQNFWCNVVDTSTYILNRILIKHFLGKTPYELFKGKKPYLEHFKVFGSKCFILNNKDYLTKLDPKSTEGVFLGYFPKSKAYIVLNKETIKVEESLNLKFDENPPPKSSPLVDEDIIENDIIENQDKDLEIKEK
ncbi:retrovirus-related pol polyprotein from transposon TNT 1-94 [Tanacetum coccineum]